MSFFNRRWVQVLASTISVLVVVFAAVLLFFPQLLERYGLEVTGGSIGFIDFERSEDPDPPDYGDFTDTNCPFRVKGFVMVAQDYYFLNNGADDRLIAHYPGGGFDFFRGDLSVYGGPDELTGYDELGVDESRNTWVDLRQKEVAYPALLCVDDTGKAFLDMDNELQ